MLERPQIMIDFETLDTKPTAIVLSVGLLAFRVEGGGLRIKRELELFPSLTEQAGRGRSISVETMLWWYDQSEEAKQGVCLHDEDDRCTVLEAQNRLAKFFETYSGAPVWARGADFERPLLESFMGYLPFNYTLIRDMRTVAKLFPLPQGILDQIRNYETAHTALGDCRTQARELIACLEGIKK